MATANVEKPCCSPAVIRVSSHFRWFVRYMPEFKTFPLLSMLPPARILQRLLVNFSKFFIEVNNINRICEGRGSFAVFMIGESRLRALIICRCFALLCRV